MICFCDIPLSMVDDHMFKYGKYGVGMTKEWGIAKGLNPVLYYNEESILIQSFFKLIFDGHIKTQELYRLAANGEWVGDGGSKSLIVDHKAEGYKEKRDAYWQVIDRLGALSGLKCYFKPRVGEYVIGGKHYPNYHFYDEREWRYVEREYDFESRNKPPKIEEVNLHGEHLSQEEKQQYNAKIEAEGKYKLDFSASDVKYIIVKSDEEIIPLVKYLQLLPSHTNNGLRFTPEEISLLTSRILTSDQIKEDF